MPSNEVTKCLYCNEPIKVPVNSKVPLAKTALTYCSEDCKFEDSYDEFGSETFEKMSKGGQEWR